MRLIADVPRSSSKESAPFWRMAMIGLVASGVFNDVEHPVLEKMIQPVCQLLPVVEQEGVPGGELSATSVVMEVHIVTQPFLLMASTRVLDTSVAKSLVILPT